MASSDNNQKYLFQPLRHWLRKIGVKVNSRQEFLNAISFIYNQVREVELYDFYKKFPVSKNVSKETIMNMIASQKKWCDENGVKGTPSIIVNGYKLSNIFTLKDLRFFVEEIQENKKQPVQL